MRASNGIWIGLGIACAVLGGVIDVAGWGFLAVAALAIWGSLVAVGIYGLWLAVCWLGLIGWRPKAGLFVVPLKVAAIAASGLVGNAVTAPAAVLPRDAPIGQQFEAMFRSDQSDRVSGRIVTMPWRDRRRLARTHELLQSTSSLTPRMQYAAAMILQHGTKPADFEFAHQLATSAHAGGIEEADQLAKAAYDRWQLSMGKPQKYGTQSQVTIGFGGVETKQP